MLKSIVYIASDDRSGSTLLDLLLGNHDEVISVGEIRRLFQCVNETKEVCMCGAPIRACPFWKRVEADYGAPLGPIRTSVYDIAGASGKLVKLILMLPLNRIYLLMLLNCFGKTGSCIQIAKNIIELYEVISKIAGAQVIVDSSKEPFQLKSIYLLEPDRLKVVVLYRDGRGVTFSRMKRGIPVEVAVRRWVKANRRIHCMSLGIPRSKILQIHYETLCGEPEKTMEDLCHFIGIDFRQSQTALSKWSRHNIGGSPMKFDKRATEISLDERWRNQMDSRSLKVFDEIAGKMNRTLGYS